MSRPDLHEALEAIVLKVAREKSGRPLRRRCGDGARARGVPGGQPTARASAARCAKIVEMTTGEHKVRPSRTSIATTGPRQTNPEIGLQNTQKSIPPPDEVPAAAHSGRLSDDLPRGTGTSFGRTGHPMQQEKSRRGVFIGAVVAAAALSLVIGFTLRSKHDGRRRSFDADYFARAAASSEHDPRAHNRLRPRLEFAERASRCDAADSRRECQARASITEKRVEDSARFFSERKGRRIGERETEEQRVRRSKLKRGQMEIREATIEHLAAVIDIWKEAACARAPRLRAAARRLRQSVSSQDRRARRELQSVRRRRERKMSSSGGKSLSPFRSNPVTSDRMAELSAYMRASHLRSGIAKQLLRAFTAARRSRARTSVRHRVHRRTE